MFTFENVLESELLFLHSHVSKEATSVSMLLYNPEIHMENSPPVTLALST